MENQSGNICSWAQQLVYARGGSYTVIGKTLDECLQKTRVISGRMKNEIFATTLPYLVIRRDTNAHIEASIPGSWRDALGDKFMSLYLATESLDVDGENMTSKDRAIDNFKQTVKSITVNDRITLTPVSNEPNTVSEHLLAAAMVMCVFACCLVFFTITDNNHTLEVFDWIMCVCGIALMIGAFITRRTP